MEIEWRTIQFFLDDQEMLVSELSVDNSDPAKMRCSCHKFAKFARCKHIKYVKDLMDDNRGIFNVTLPPEVPDEEVIEAAEDLELFRELILKYGKVIIL